MLSLSPFDENWENQVISTTLTNLNFILEHSTPNGIEIATRTSSSLLQVEASLQALLLVLTNGQKLLVGMEKVIQKCPPAKAEKRSKLSNLVNKYKAEYASLDVMVTEVLSYGCPQPTLGIYIHAIGVRPSFQ
ncbi:hypothetical protein ScalyP_jg9031 [Parmales sp. scaly parma]|nr:hypothetical protein ScalyP_jg9031 [Parmales sp. scaly parma]|tara:strand:+ start:272 stop:670 length:399 start_codon:yes stop_codon:yes gene_type:complete